MYIGRFAPSPTGPLHAGSLVAALASWLDARAHEGKWLVRIEDVDTPRTVKGADETILQQLHALSLVPDEPPVWQSTRSALYDAALASLHEQRLIYACTCSRKEMEQAILARGIARERHTELRYLGTCRHAINTPLSTYTQHSLRVLTQVIRAYPNNPNDSICKSEITYWYDRNLGVQQQDVQNTCGDFVLKRADGCYTYQLAVVVDDAAQGITHIVRGEDLADNTARQIILQQHLRYRTPQYLHTPLVLAADGEKLSKQNGAAALETTEPLKILWRATQVLGLGLSNASALTPADFLMQATKAWRDLYRPA
jgi:glutamyl-Q tRNA(Asp) synthetase